MSTGNPSWSVVVTTAPRQSPKLNTTINSLQTAGWKDPVVFAEPDSPACDAETYTNKNKLGVFHNWIRAARHALDTDADVIMTVQDDVWFHPDSKWFAESILWPDKCAFLSLYTPLHYSIIQGKQKPWGVYPVRTRSLWGAMAMIWRPSILERVVDSSRAKNWIGKRSAMTPQQIAHKEQNPETIRNVDTFIGYCATRDIKLNMYYVNPSFVQHISECSSIGGRAAEGKRAARFMVGSDGAPNANNIPL
jgi:hypothetical protein